MQTVNVDEFCELFIKVLASESLDVNDENQILVDIPFDFKDRLELLLCQKTNLATFMRIFTNFGVHYIDQLEWLEGISKSFTSYINTIKLNDHYIDFFNNKIILMFNKYEINEKLDKYDEQTIKCLKNFCELFNNFIELYDSSNDYYSTSEDTEKTTQSAKYVREHLFKIESYNHKKEFQDKVIKLYDNKKNMIERGFNRIK